MSRIYEEAVRDGTLEVFEGKEVLVKVITLSNEDSARDQKLELIEQISTATNRQTAVTNADRLSAEKAHIEVQHVLFERFGLLYERKSGEFRDGQHNGYVQPEQIVERNQFLRLFLAANGNLRSAIKKKLFATFNADTLLPIDIEKLDRFYFAYRAFPMLTNKPFSSAKRRKELMAKVLVLAQRRFPGDTRKLSNDELAVIVLRLEQDWIEFAARVAATNKKFVRTFVDRQTNEKRYGFSEEKWIASGQFDQDLARHFGVALK